MRVENKKLEDWIEFLANNRYLPMSDKSGCPSGCNNTNFTETEGYEDDEFIIHTYKCDCEVLFYKIENNMYQKRNKKEINEHAKFKGKKKVT